MGSEAAANLFIRIVVQEKDLSHEAGPRAGLG